MGGSGAIQFEAYAGPAKTPTSFGGIEVHHNTIRHVNRSGINEGSDFRSRHSVGGSINDNPFDVWAPMDVHDNIVSDVGGDAIVTQFASGTEVYNNSVWAASNFHGGKSPSGNNAAVWAWDADDVQYYNNHVFDTVMMPGTWDGTAFDSDYGTTGTTFEYNVTHDNEGGFMLFCGCGGLSTQTVLRYNMSINDGRGAEDHSSGVRVFFVAGQTDAEVYNNTFLVYPNAKIDAGSSGSSGVVYQNNVFLAQGNVRTDSNPGPMLTSPFRTNLYGGTAGNWPQANLNGNTVDAGLKANGGGGLGTVLVDGNLVASKGTPIVKEQSVDLANNDVPLYEKPDLGAFQTGAGSIVAATTALVNGGFENNAAGWDLSEDASITSDERRGGQNALALETEEATASQSFPAGTNRTSRLVASVQADAEGNLPEVALTNPEGFSAIAAALDADAVVEAGEWINVSATMRTAWDGTDLTVNVTGVGLVDDIAVDLVKDYMVDGSFQNRSNTPWKGGGRTEDDSISGGLGASIPASGTAENVETVVPDLDEAYTLSGWIKGEGLRLGAKLFAGADSNAAVSTDSADFKQYSMDVTPTNNRFRAFAITQVLQLGSVTTSPS